MNRPDIVDAILQQFMSHWISLKRLLQYLHATSFYALQITKALDLHPLAYSDSDWISNPNDRTSTTGYIIYLRNSPISWSSKKHHSVSCSSTEVEYQVVAAAVVEQVEEQVVAEVLTSAAWQRQWLGRKAVEAGATCTDDVTEAVGLGDLGF
ncbi:secreted RxLR effector protein 161-like [Gossypium hirsutum]|uniref:Secreted RxLR effector protein 161-like n=1 Tax=Gossypium hirsutum TaxID=3635 RepID=A0ABM2ZBQ8_GOSHI|nr:secreted RxLR effector protein 161-like [Gossypium hirsutum]